MHGTSGSSPPTSGHTRCRTGGCGYVPTVSVYTQYAEAPSAPGCSSLETMSRPRRDTWSQYSQFRFFAQSGRLLAITIHMGRCNVIAIGASAGGIEALLRLLADIPSDLDAAVAIAVHTPENSPSVLPRILGRKHRQRTTRERAPSCGRS